MGMRRTQVYFPNDLRERLHERARAEGNTMAGLIREAVESYLEDDDDLAAALDATFGAVPTVALPSRDEWDRG